MSKIKKGENSLLDSMMKSYLEDDERPQKKKAKALLDFADPLVTKDDIKAYEKSIAESNPLVKSFLNVLNGPGQTIERLAFDEDPDYRNQYQTIYKGKIRLLPDDMLKRISIQDDLVAAIVNLRASMMSAFGRPQPDRFSTGYKIEPEPGLFEKLEENQRLAFQERIAKAEAMLLTCGKTAGWKDSEALNFGQFLYMACRDAVTFGRMAVEVLQTGAGSDKKFHSFRPMDSGTIYRASNYKNATAAVRKEALKLLEQLKNKKLIPERYVDDEYAFVQVIRGRPRQAFTAEECLVHNFYPATHIELNGYPITPLDTVISAVTTHINITTHNKLYFQNGRAAKGMIVIQSDDISKEIIGQIRQQFNASINSVSSAWRTPIFGVGQEDKINWMPIDSSSRDMEFQYLSDSNARTILSAFAMSPEEVPGLSHLSRGTNSQALCMHPKTKVWTDSGFKQISEIIDTKFNVWTGTVFVPARAFKTGTKTVQTTKFSNGQTVKTSPDHLFRTMVGPNLVWKRQAELKAGDWVLSNKEPTPATVLAPVYNGKALTPEMMEVLGWLTGDGTVWKRKTSQGIELYYHHIKEPEIRDRHLAFLRRFGLNAKLFDQHISSERQEKIKARCGFKTVAPVRLRIILNDGAFANWLVSLGFSWSTGRKTIPAIFHGLAPELRYAFLRGFFSADGSLTGRNKDAPEITIVDDATREETKALLASLGIRTSSYEGSYKTTFTNINGMSVKGHTKAKTRLNIKDRDLFFKNIGFLQSHKQTVRNFDSKINVWDRTSIPMALWVADELTKTLPKNHEDVATLRSKTKSESCSRQNVQELALKHNIKLPEWFDKYHHETVTETVPSNETIEMVDIEVFNNDHAFMASGIVVHNSESNSEYKLEAHRDVGLRPLIAHFQNFINARILPLIDEDLSKTCSFKFVGLDAETAEKEAARIGAEINIHLTMDDILEKVQKKAIGEGLGGKMILNPQWQQSVAPYLHVGYIREHIFGIKGASKDPEWQFCRDPFWFQFQQMLMQQQQMQQQAQMAQQQPQGAGGGQDPQTAQNGTQPGQPQPREGQGGAQQQPQQEQDLSTSIDQASNELSKTEAQLPASKKALIRQQKQVIQHFLDGWETESKEVIDSIIKTTKPFISKKKKDDK